ncbi:hypothetical protein B0T24DRAFT_597506 [Lasiosphaeria ovina]|uniref:RRM domain-containing protein n=1 Tax=Lasiosphaeria ovina TaxID=92902 RepID=A0AAE0JWR3_9PEZI|nr:hypothetical protein B0T24DRAFT_597506 [Lasiosphaeria ovina]
MFMVTSSALGHWVMLTSSQRAMVLRQVRRTCLRTTDYSLRCQTPLWQSLYAEKTRDPRAASRVNRVPNSGDAQRLDSRQPRFGHVSKPSNSDTSFSHGVFTSNISGFADRHPRRGGNIPGIKHATNAAEPRSLYCSSEAHSPQGVAPHFQNVQAFQHAQHQNLQQEQNGASSPFYSPQSPSSSYSGMPGQMHVQMQTTSPVSMAPGFVIGTRRTVHLGSIPPGTAAEEILGHVRSGQIESVRLLPDKNCALISFLDASSATHFHSDAILKKLCIKGQDIKIGWGNAVLDPPPLSEVRDRYPILLWVRGATIRRLGREIRYRSRYSMSMSMSMSMPPGHSDRSRSLL